MGGSAFTELFTPRMPPQIYNRILTQTLVTIRQHFAHVSSPISAPGKADYGDIDILCFGPLTPAYDPTLTPKANVTETVAKELGAKAWIVGKKGQGMSLAIAWPKDGSVEEVEEVGDDEAKLEDGQEKQKPKFIQLDIHIIPTLTEYNWELFHTAHGDLWNILGSTIRHFGLTVNNLGLYLRIPEIELLDRKKSMVFLTDDPNTILQFLGLDPEKWWTPFETQEDMFEYAAGCRLFWIKERLEEGEGGGDVVGEIQTPLGAENPESRTNGCTNLSKGLEGGASGKKKLKHNDRQRLAKRPIFQSWIEEFIPACRTQGRYLTCQTSREEIRDEAFVRFAVKGEYEGRLKDWVLERHRDEVWRVGIKGCVPIEGVDPVVRAASLRYLKGVIMEGGVWEGEEKGKVVEAATRDEDIMWDLEAVKAFVFGHWEEAGRLGLVVQQKRAMESMKAKAERKAKLAEQEGIGGLEGKENVKVAA